jgi:N-methylhydantoinase A
VTIAVPNDELGPASASDLAARFELEYKRLYGRIASGNPLEAINWRVVASASTPGLPLEHLARRDGAMARQMIKGTRPVYLPERGGFADVEVYDRYALMPDFSFVGPAIVEERESTVVIGDRAKIVVDALLNLVVSMP